MKGPYKIRERARVLVEAVETGKLKKNVSYPLSEDIAEILNVSLNTLYRMTGHMPPDYSSEVNEELWKQRPWTIRGTTVTKKVKALKLEGCQLGPLGLVRWPVLPRLLEWAAERPKRPFRAWLQSHPRI